MIPAREVHIMPMYEYRCAECDTVSEFLTGVSREEPEIVCSSCGSTNLKKLISASNFTMARAASPQYAPCGAGPGETCEHCQHAE